jgi:hypothetical protein
MLILMSAAPHPSETNFVDVTGVLFDATIPYNLTFFESLNRVVQYEPWLERDRAMIDQLKSIGIQQGKSFSPDAATNAQLTSAIDEAHAWLIHQYETAYPKYYSGQVLSRHRGVGEVLYERLYDHGHLPSGLSLHHLLLGFLQRPSSGRGPVLPA